MSLEHCVKSRPREKRRICIFILFAIVFVFLLLFTERRNWPRNKNKATRCWVRPDGAPISSSTLQSRREQELIFPTTRLTRRALLCSAAVHWLMDLPQSSAQSSSALYTVSSALSSLFSCVYARGTVGYVLVLFFFFSFKNWKRRQARWSSALCMLRCCVYAVVYIQIAQLQALHSWLPFLLFSYSLFFFFKKETFSAY